MALLFAIALSFIAGGSHIYRCEVADGPPLFSDLPCRGGTLVEIATGSVVSMTPLTPQERERLAALSDSSEARAADRRRARKQARALSRAEAEQKRKQCTGARSQLRALEVRRRKGYSLAESVKMARLTDALKEAVRANC